MVVSMYHMVHMASFCAIWQTKSIMTTTWNTSVPYGRQNRLWLPHGTQQCHMADKIDYDYHMVHEIDYDYHMLPRGTQKNSCSLMSFFIPSSVRNFAFHKELRTLWCFRGTQSRFFTRVPQKYGTQSQFMFHTYPCSSTPFRGTWS